MFDNENINTIKRKLINSFSNKLVTFCKHSFIAPKNWSKPRDFGIRVKD